MAKITDYLKDTGLGTDAAVGDVNVTFIDGHVEIDTLGSEAQYSK